MISLTLQNIFIAVGLFVTSYYTFRFVFLLVDILLPGKSLSNYGAGKDGWAVVTGATDGIGRALCIEMAQKKMNLILVSRNMEKLNTLKAELEEFGIKVKVVSIDFASAASKDWDSVKNVIESVNVSALINCAGLSHDYPKPFEQEDLSRCDDILEVNCNSLTKMTRLVIPRMKTRRNGLILNIGSFVSTVPSPYLAMYSGSKSFVQVFSQALGAELARCGSSQPFTTVPYFSHALINYIVETYMSRKFWLNLSKGHLEGIRKRALAKQAKAKKQ
ncbi:hypothetical protein BB561_006320 [Smittium simulii]|uniref:Very-long-chain 3-oxoacyl-CoA reductase n=1 Tax=Smittium simulii TaxID=133385 RepID=A0A2T9Y545_9FUNG|nr:hypothetical protein BB561_006320 [Smittium simulii]